MQCRDETEEAERVIADIRRLVDEARGEPRDFAILCRTNEQPRSFETELRRADLPYVLVGGMSFFDRKEVRDILAYLKVIENPHDEPALRRQFNLPAMKDGTRQDVQRTMLGARQLAVDKHPHISFRSTAIEPQGDGRLRVRGELSLHGRTREVTFPADFSFSDGVLRAKAKLRFAQSDFGIEPYRFAFGAVRNRDQVELLIELVAR